MSVAHVGLVHRDPCRCKVKGFCVVSSIERNVSMRHLQEVRHLRSLEIIITLVAASVDSCYLKKVDISWHMWAQMA